jgi:plasmid stability protein
MASITIRNLDEVVKMRLRIRAAEHSRSMEEEARCILREVLDRQRPQTLADIALEMFGQEHGVELDSPPPADPREPPSFDEA